MRIDIWPMLKLSSEYELKRLIIDCKNLLDDREKEKELEENIRQQLIREKLAKEMENE